MTKAPFRLIPFDVPHAPPSGSDARQGMIAKDRGACELRMQEGFGYPAD